MMEKRVLLTGGGGFIGRNIVEQMRDDFLLFAPSSAELDLLNPDAVAGYLKNYRITHVIHAAVYNQKRREQNPGADLGANLKMFYNLASHARELEKIIYFGSGAEFDKRFPIHMAKEEDFGKSIPLLNDYSLSKYLMNLEARRSENIYNLRLFGVFGKYEPETCLVSHLCRCAMEGRPLTIHQECAFDFIHVDDIIPVLRWMLESQPRYHDYNLCSGRPVMLYEMADMVREISGKNLNIVFLKEGRNLEYTGSNDRLSKECPFKFAHYVIHNIREKIKLIYIQKGE